MNAVPKPVYLSARGVSIEDVVRVSGGSPVAVDASATFAARICQSADTIAARVENGTPTYGVNTGFGASVRNTVPRDSAYLLAQNLPRYHGCGVDPLLSEAQSRAVVLVRSASLATGFSGVRMLVLERLCQLLSAGAAPAIPSRGSVGASGDLTPLSYVCALLVGERQAWFRGALTTADAVHRELGLTPLVLGPKESLAIMNGTSVMTALICLSIARAERLGKLASALTAMLVEAMAGQHAHFDERLFLAKPHAGQIACAAQIRDVLGVPARPAARGLRIQERYSIRCAPHVIGVLFDALPFCRSVIGTEINGASDNPLIDPDTGEVLHGGNFYGGHAAMVGDLLKTQVASVADLMERQLVVVNDPEKNGGLPENLVAVTGPSRFAHHGFKAMEISASALTAEALKLTMPATSFSRSTESHNQDKVSMGSLAALDLERVLDLSESVAAIHLLALTQAVELRGLDAVSEKVRVLHGRVREVAAPAVEDRPMDGDIRAVCGLIAEGRLLDGVV
jgi:histidine ammonia-lyase